MPFEAEARVPCDPTREPCQVLPEAAVSGPLEVLRVSWGFCFKGHFSLVL